MAQRAFKYFTITSGGTPQPAFGTYITASVVAGNEVSIPVGDSSMFAVGDYALALTKTNTNRELMFVHKIPDGTHVQVASMVANHTGGVFGTGEFLCLANPCNSVYIQSLDGNGGALFLGTLPTMVTATGVNMILKMIKVAGGVQPMEYNSTRGPWNPDNTAQVWIDGTSADSYLPSYGVY